jgi:hypothetical protein
MDTMTTRDFLAEIEWEGGVEAAIEYGLAPTDAADPEVTRRWQAIVDQYEGQQVTGRSLHELVSDLHAYAMSGDH